ncbi:unnamed protein product [Symbiodinium natans]|uniref:Uncharacterized protein n=1 Tax=Symbiodinium natans TaxID=878477 RepID=A0A812UZV1_9DINO|nr:unnamed protein product [Symbiodinium natans]
MSQFQSTMASVVSPLLPASQISAAERHTASEQKASATGLSYFPGGDPGRSSQPLPEAHQLYSYGQRQIGYTNDLAVPQYNRGVAIVQDRIGAPPQLGHQIVHSDEAIQNSNWSHIGPMLRVHDGTYWSSKASTDVADFELKGAQWGQAVDVRGLQNVVQRGASRSKQAEANFHRLYKLRNGGYA